MINTIFYFVDSLAFDTYKSQIRSGDISNKTIVFVEDTKSIYMGGKSYSYDDTALYDEIDRVERIISDLRDNIDGTISDIRGDVQAASDLAQDLKDRLDDVLEELDDDIKDKIESLFDDAQWLLENFPQGAVTWLNGWNDEIEAYLSTVGVWSRDGDVTKTQWSDLTLSVNRLEGSVSSLTTTTNGLVTISEGLDSTINAAINGTIAELNLGTTYAKINDVKGILEWMYSGLKSASSSSLTYNELVSAAKNDQLGISAISEIRTSIEKLGDTYAAITEMNTLVNDSLATLIQEVNPNQTLTSIINQLGTNTSNISAITSKVEAIEHGGYISLSQMLNTLENELDGTTTTSSVKSKVNNLAKTAAATLFSEVSNEQDNITAASIVNAITNDTNAVTSLSSYFLDSDDVETIVNNTLNASVNGGTWATWVSYMTGNVVTKAEIIASVNADQSNVKISADKINLTGDTIISKINDPNNLTVISGGSINANEVVVNGTSIVNSLITDKLTGGEATFNGNVNATQFLAGDPNGINITTSSDRISFNIGENPKAYFIQDSAGFLLYVYHDDDWYSINFDNWNSANNPNLPSKSMSIYKIVDGVSNIEEKMIYYSNLNKCYTDYNGTTFASDSNTSGYYVLINPEVMNMIADLPEWMTNFYFSDRKYYMYPLFRIDNKIIRSEYALNIYLPITFSSSGKMIIDTTFSNIYLINGHPTVGNHQFVTTTSSIQTVNSSDIHMGNHETTLTDHASSMEQTYDSNYQIYVSEFLNTAATLNHVSSLELINNYWTAINI